MVKVRLTYFEYKKGKAKETGKEYEFSRFVGHDLNVNNAPDVKGCVPFEEMVFNQNLSSLVSFPLPATVELEYQEGIGRTGKVQRTLKEVRLAK